MADRVSKIRDAAEILADDAEKLAAKLRSRISESNYEAAEQIAGNLQRAARDVKWLMQRQPRQRE